MLSWGACLGFAVSLLSYKVTVAAIEHFLPLFERRGFIGHDLAKPQNVGVPEYLGLVSGVVTLLVCFVTQAAFTSDAELLLEYNAGLTTLTFMLLLGFVDDVLDLRWRDKIVLPLLAMTPVLIIYSGSTAIYLPTVCGVLLEAFAPVIARLPVILRPEVWPAVGNYVLVELGPLWYRLIILGLSVFSTNAINIYAGVNGLEAGQAVVMCLTVIANILFKLAMGEVTPHTTYCFIVSFAFLLPTVALWKYNKYPARLFVGNSFTYFAGAYFTVIALMGHSTRFLLPLFGPQFLNFLVSTPQLVGLLPCPRHRVPRLNSASGLLEPSKGNHTLINYWLRVRGPLHEAQLVKELLALQVGWSMIIFITKAVVV
ncbi:MAG: uncharacterized protein KVP18_002085 [Porospora cf. gigantea A]|uniref:uncharacterized protein n=1 Tax=Porospora cf. gigantea A TaxID=2853593 RepID=UPI00355A12BD|nr:MAG: hypothetical protein KVP18_002085 [Porospora cf. gigantea A]